MRRRLPGIAQIGGHSHGHVYHIDTTRIIRGRTITQKYFEGPEWFYQMRLLANPWHIKRRWQVELGFKLLAVARSERIRWVVTE